jgi:cell division septal protein FtsQ
MKKLFLILVLLLAVVGIVFFVIKSIKVVKINCQSQYGECNSNLQSKIAQIKKNPLFETRGDLIDLLKKDKSIIDFSVRFGLPYNFDVYVIEKKALVAFLLKNGHFALVDKDGLIVNEAEKTNLPKIISIELDHDQLQFAANLISRLYIFYKINSAKITQEGIEVDNLSGKTVLFPLSGNDDELLGALSLIISRLPSVKEASTIKVVDLRFKNPVLK